MTTTNKKISFLISTLGLGGAERVCVTIANELCKRNWDIEIIVFKHVSENLYDRLLPQVSFTNLEVGRARYAPKRLREHLHNTQPRVLIAFNNEVILAEYSSSIFRKRPYKLIYRSVTTPSSIKFQSTSSLTWLRMLFLRTAIKSADIVIGQCNAMSKDLKNTFGSLSNLITIYNPLKNDIEDVTEQNTRQNLILFVGRLDKNKSVESAISAFSKIESKLDNCRFLIAGDGPEKENLVGLSQELGVSDKVEFLGHISNVNELYQSASILTLTSHYEGFPNVLLEAISHGVPVVSFDCPSGPNEIILDNVNGFLVKKRSIDDLACRLDLAISKTWDRNKVQNTARRFEKTKIVDEWEAQINSVIGIT